jgi:MoaA/NifB/PqqE/SkfB family radical SAM enzyme
MIDAKRLYPAEDYIELAMSFGCNLKCSHCMIEGTMELLNPQSLEQFHSLLSLNKQESRWTGLTLTGAEITLDPRLAEMASLALDHGFKNIRIQTHGGQLADPDFTAKLIDSGINEFFISVTASTPEAHDRITGVPGSFERTLQGIANVSAYPSASVITNTVITDLSYQHLPAVVALLSQYAAVKQLEFWYYFPMRSADHKFLLVPADQCLPYLLEAFRIAYSYSLPVEIKNFPQCLLGSFQNLLYNDQPQLEIDPRFWDEFGRNGFYQCTYKSQCTSSMCLGLSTAYIHRFGWEADILHPLIGPSISGLAGSESIDAIRQPEP